MSDPSADEKRLADLRAQFIREDGYLDPIDLSELASLALKALDAAQARVHYEVLSAALKLLVDDVADYPAWQRPCHALNVAREALSRSNLAMSGAPPANPPS